MVIRKNEMEIVSKEKMRGGDGTIKITMLENRENMKHCRLLSSIVIPAGASIGEHRHDAETEYYIILKGSAVVVDNGTEVQVGPGDVVVTGNGASHSIRNEGDSDMEMIAVILTEAE